MYLNSERLFFSDENIEKFREEENNIHNEIFKRAGIGPSLFHLQTKNNPLVVDETGVVEFLGL